MAGHAARFDIRKQDTAAQVNGGDDIGAGGRYESGGAIGQDDDLLGTRSHSDRAERAQGGRVEKFNRGVIAIRDEERMAAGRELRRAGMGSPGGAPRAAL